MGYVLKGCSAENLVLAVREAAAGRRFFSPPVAEVAGSSLIGSSKTGPPDAHDTLTLRQRQVLQLTAEGKTSAEIGTLLNISPRTVENHRANIMERLDLHNHTDLIRHAIRYGLISPER
jgi:DNA-binding NarL/FixJ family response regulator